MPEYPTLDRMFHALGDSSRRAMVERLTRGPASVSELAQPFEMALPTVESWRRADDLRARSGYPAG